MDELKTINLSCKHCGSYTRTVKNSKCLCVKERLREYYLENRETRLKYQNTYYTLNKDKVKEHSANRRKDNPDYAKEYASSHKEESKIYQQRPYVKLKAAAKSNKRRADKIDATPNWYCKEQEAAMLHFRNLLTNTFKEEHHLDHIIPLNHPKVCGLHCKDNWQILTAKDNLAKSNKWDGTYNNTGE